jgi:uncharacterized protein (DUF1697 family)
MPVIISMLRAVNVGGRRVKMDALRALYETLDLRDPQTYVQSGNVVFGTRVRDLRRLATSIEEAIQKAFGFHSDVILRTAAEMKSVMERNPFAGREEIAPSKLLVVFYAADPAPGGAEKIRSLEGFPEELHLDGRELYIYFPDGMGRSKLPFAAIDKAMKTPGTGRNWNGVVKLLEMAEQMESS